MKNIEIGKYTASCDTGMPIDFKWNKKEKKKLKDAFKLLSEIENKLNS